MLEKKIEFSCNSIRKGVLRRFEEINPGALHVFMILVAHSKNKIARISTTAIQHLTDFSPYKTNECLNGLERKKYIKKLKGKRARIYRIIL